MSEKLEKQIEELKKRIEELEGKSEPTELPFWMPTDLPNPGYYYLTSCGSVEYTDFESSYPQDQQRIAIGNYVETDEICEKRKAKLELLEEIKRWRGKHDPESFRLDWEDEEFCKNALVYDVHESRWDFLAVATYRTPLNTYLSHNAPLDDFIKHFGNRLDILLEVD